MMRRTDSVSLSPSLIRLLAGVIAWGALPPSFYQALQGTMGWTLPGVFIGLLALAGLSESVARRVGTRRFMPQLIVLLVAYLLFGALVDIYMAITFVPYSPIPRIPALVHGIVFLGLAILAAWKLRMELTHA